MAEASWSEIAIVKDFEFGAVPKFLDQYEVVLKRRKECVAFDDPLDQREIQIRTKRQRFLIKARAAANKNDRPVWIRAVCSKLAKAGNGPNARDRGRRTGQNHGGPVGQGLANGFESLSPHDDHLAGGHLFEPAKILGQVPRNFISRANHSIEGHGGDGLEWFQRMRCWSISDRASISRQREGMRVSVEGKTDTVGDWFHLVGEFI